MKHDVKIIIALTVMFLATQAIGLGLLNLDIEVRATPTGGQEIIHGETAIGPRPEIAGSEVFIMVIVSVLIGTGLLLLLIRIGRIGLWKIMYFLAVFLTISIALGVLIEPLAALIIALVLASIKVFRQDVFIHNVTEVLVYSGLAILFVPLFELAWIMLLLVVISIYDMFAVWKSGHMVKIARSLTDTKIFAGFSISYRSRQKGNVKQVRKAEKDVEGGGEISQAILGGGDVAFPLMFAGVVMESMISMSQVAKEIAFLKVMVIPLVVTVMLVGLFVLGKRGKFYPAMPFLTIGCFLGLGILSIL